MTNGALSSSFAAHPAIRDLEATIPPRSARARLLFFFSTSSSQIVSHECRGREAASCRSFLLLLKQADGWTK